MSKHKQEQVARLLSVAKDIQDVAIAAGMPAKIIRLRLVNVNKYSNGMDAHYPKRHQSAKVVVQ